jgi:transposase
VEVWSALEWAQVRALAADGVSQREIAQRLGINRRTVARLAAADEPPRYRREPVGSQLDPLEPVLRRLLEEWPQIKAPRLTEILRADYGYTGSLRLVQARLQELRPRPVRPAQRTGYRPGQVLQLDGVVPRGAYACAGVAGRVPRECVYDNLRSVVARREGGSVVWNRRFLYLRGHYGFHGPPARRRRRARKGAVEAAVRSSRAASGPRAASVSLASSTASTSTGASASATVACT